MSYTLLFMSGIILVFSVFVIFVGISVTRRCNGYLKLSTVMIIFIAIVIAVREILAIFNFGYNETVAGFMRLGIVSFALAAILLMEMMIKSVINKHIKKVK